MDAVTMVGLAAAAMLAAMVLWSGATGIIAGVGGDADATPRRRAHRIAGGGIRVWFGGAVLLWLAAICGAGDPVRMAGTWSLATLLVVIWASRTAARRGDH